MGLCARWRLRRRCDFGEVYAHGRRYSHPLLVVYILLRQDSGHPRLGVSLSRRLGKAVSRNRTRRRLQEAMRPLLPALRGRADLVLIPKPGALEASVAALSDALRSLLQRGGLWEASGARWNAQTGDSSLQGTTSPAPRVARASSSPGSSP